MQGDPKPRPIRPSRVVYAFVPTIEDAHRVTGHIFRSAPDGTFVGFNQSTRGEGYIVVDASIDISAEVLEVLEAEPLQVATQEQVGDDPNGFGVIHR